MSLEERLRDLLADDRLAPGPGVDPVARIEQLVDRRRHWWWRRVAACVAAVALAVAGAAVVRQTVLVPAAPAPTEPSLPPDVVPWLDAPPVTQQSFQPVPTTARACGADDFEPYLTGAMPEGDVAHGTFSVQTRPSGTPCLITAAPTLTGRRVLPGSHLADERTTVPLEPDPGLQAWADPVVPAVITPGGSAGFALAIDYRCQPKGPVFMELKARIAGKEFDWPGISLGSNCPIRIGPWAASRTRPPDADTDSLRPSIEAPATVRLGSTVTYVLTLRNSGPQPVQLEPCPHYWHGLLGTDPASQIGVVAHQLNCAPGTIAAGQAVRFEMRLAVPDRLPPGPAKLTWAWGTGSSLPMGAEAPVTLVR